MKKENKSQKKYILDMFPYPSGAGLHVGHLEGYTATDIYSRYMRLRGHEVLHPIGWDAFGLPAENYAIKTGIHPAETTKKAIVNFKKQMEMAGLSYDWSREINTSDPKFYKWTQWLFLQLYKKGLAYKKKAPVNWCDSCKTVLANEQVVDTKCERCGQPVIQKDLEQWFFKVTAYAEELLNEIDKMDWPEALKHAQRNWIGKSEGALLKFQITSTKKQINSNDLNPKSETNSKLQIINFKHDKILLATNNLSKKARIEKLLKSCGLNITVLLPQDMNLKDIKVLEEGDLLENAKEKALAYRKLTDLPILGIDTGFFIDGEEIDPVKVKRNALTGKKEEELKQEEIANLILDFYRTIAKKNGGEIEAHWEDALALSLPDGSIKTFKTRREVILTDKVSGNVDIYFPLRSMYKIKATGKYVSEMNDEEELRDLQPITDALIKLLSGSQDLGKIEVFTTRPDTLFGATYLVLAPEHEIIKDLRLEIQNYNEVDEYIKKAKTKNKLERTDLAKEKTGVELKGVKAINPGSNEEIPIWIADYVLTDYGTGAIMAVPAHDERDFEFARKYKLPIVPVIQPADAYKSYFMERSFIDGLEAELKKLNFKFKTVKNDGFFIEFNGNQLNEYISLVKKYLNKKFWCEIIGSEYIFIYGGGEFIKVVDKESGDQALELCKKYYDKMNAHYNLYDMLWNCEFYHDLVCYTGSGKLINSNKNNNLTTEEAKDKIFKVVGGKKQTQFKIRDWLISRQRYWGAPIPIIYCDKCGLVPVSEKDLPVLLPTDVDFRPTGESPLARSKEFHQIKCPKCGGQARRESDTLDVFVCSSWYFLRYVDSNNDKEFASSANIKKWLPVDLYIGGMEHAVGHLIYARFMTKALRDLGYLDFNEPFLKIINQGIILAEDSRKMSKRWGNVINPDDVVKEYGADTLRMYEMFMGPLEDMKPWDSKGIIGVKRFLDKVNNLVKIKNQKLQEPNNDQNQNNQNNLEKLLHKTIKKVTEDIEALRFNTAISAMMIYINHVSDGHVSNSQIEKFLIILSPFAPFLTEELWKKLGHKDSIFQEKWPKFNEELLREDEILIIVQINGKKRDELKVTLRSTGSYITEDEIKTILQTRPKLKQYLEGKEIKKFIYIKDKLVNIVV